MDIIGFNNTLQGLTLTYRTDHIMFALRYKFIVIFNCLPRYSLGKIDVHRWETAVRIEEASVDQILRKGKDIKCAIAYRLRVQSREAQRYRGK